MATITVEDTDLRAFARVLAKVFGVQALGDAAALAGLIQTLTQKVQTMSDKIDQGFADLSAKDDRLAAAVTSLEQRVAQQDQKLTTAQTERDQAVADLATTKTTLDQVRAELAAIPQVDTASIESRLQAESTKVAGVISRLDAIDAAPVPAPPADTTGADTGTTAPAAGGDTGGVPAADQSASSGGDTNAPPGTGTAL